MGAMAFVAAGGYGRRVYRLANAGITLACWLPLRAALAVRDSLAAEQERWFAWTVAGFVTGAALYFEWPSEVTLWLAAVVAAVGIAIALAGLTRTNVVLSFLLCPVGRGVAGISLREGAHRNGGRADRPSRHRTSVDRRPHRNGGGAR